MVKRTGRGETDHRMPVQRFTERAERSADFEQLAQDGVPMVEMEKALT